MIYMQGQKEGGDKIKVIVLDSSNLAELKKGRPAKTPDGSVLIAWTADLDWLATKLLQSGGDVDVIGRLVDESAKRPEKPTAHPPGTPMVQKIFED